MSENNCLYIFLDEGGNLDFSSSGTQFFSLTCVTMLRPFVLNSPLENYKYDLIAWGLDFEYFHCAENNRHVRDKVFALMGDYLSSFKIDSLVVEKRKTELALQDERKFYPKMLGNLLEQVINEHNYHHYQQIIIITDTIPIAKKKQA